MKKIFARFVIFALLIGLNALAITFGGAVGCGSDGGGGVATRKVVVNVSYPEGLDKLADSGKLIAEGALYKTSTMFSGDKVSGPVKGTFNNSTTIEFAFPSNVADGKYYLNILFKDGPSASTASSGMSLKSMVLAKSGGAAPTQSECLCVLTAQERCEKEMWEASAVYCTELEEKCKQSISEVCGKDLSAYECKPEENTNCDDSSTVSSQNASTGSSESEDLTYQASSAPVVASIMANITFADGKNAQVTFNESDFDLSYDDNGDGVTKLRRGGRS